jgi:hypothetical protein
LDGYYSTSILYDPVANAFSNGPDLIVPMAEATASSLTNGDVLFAGGGIGLNVYPPDTLGTRNVTIYQSSFTGSAPVVIGITPSTLTGFNDVTITIQGSGFLSNATVTIFGTGSPVGTPLATTYVSSMQLTAAVPASYMVNVGNQQIVVSNLGGPSATPYTILIQNALFDLVPIGGLSFGNVGVGNPSAIQTETIEVGGNAPLVLGAITLTGTNASDFSISNTSTCPIGGGSVQVATQCTINVVFTPNTTGALSAQLTLPNNSVTSPVTVALTGTGIQSPAASLSTSSLAFGSQQTGTSTAAQSVTLTNSGDLALAISGINLSDPSNYSETNNCGSNLAAGSNCTIQVTFAPSTTGPLNSSLNIYDNAPSASQTVALSGTGTSVTMGAASGGSTTQSVPSGQPATYNLQVTPSGFTGTLNLSVNCSSVPATTCSVSPNPISASGTAATPFAVTVTTTQYMAGLKPDAGRRNTPGRHLPLTVAAMSLLFCALLLMMRKNQGSAAWRIPANAFAAIAMLMLLGALVACSSGGGGTPPPSGTPAGTYTVTTTASGNGINETITLTLTVEVLPP